MNFPKFLTTGGKQMTDPHNINPPPLPVRHQPPRQFSEVAARAAQHVHDLEMTIDALQAEVHALTARLTVAEERAKSARDDCERLVADRDYHKEKCVVMQTHLNNAAHLILEAMSVPVKSGDAQQSSEAPALTLQDLEMPQVTESAHIQTELEFPAAKKPGNGKKRSGGDIDG